MGEGTVSPDWGMLLTGLKSVVLPEGDRGDDVVVGAGVAVTESSRSSSIVAGIPVQVIGMRKNENGGALQNRASDHIEMVRESWVSEC
jgi:serine acetyltransferase